MIRNTIPIFPSRYVSRRIGVKRRRRRKIPPYVTNSDNENGTKRNKMKRNETISSTASRILYRRQPCNDQGERTYILMYRYWCPAIDNSTRINHYFFFFSVRKSSKSSGLSIAREGWMHRVHSTFKSRGYCRVTNGLSHELFLVTFC